MAHFLTLFDSGGFRIKNGPANWTPNPNDDALSTATCCRGVLSCPLASGLSESTTFESTECGEASPLNWGSSGWQCTCNHIFGVFPLPCFFFFFRVLSSVHSSRACRVTPAPGLLDTWYAAYYMLKWLRNSRLRIMCPLRSQKILGWSQENQKKLLIGFMVWYLFAPSDRPKPQMKTERVGCASTIEPWQPAPPQSRGRRLSPRAIPHGNKHEECCDTIARSIARCEKYHCWASKLGGELPKKWAQNRECPNLDDQDITFQSSLKPWKFLQCAWNPG